MENFKNNSATFPRLVISAPHRSSGKTTLSIGICAALNKLGFKVQPFKKGPDFIDPMWLSLASSRECRNLDLFMMGEDNINRSFFSAGFDADINIIEGNMGLYDGYDVEGTGSTAQLARLLKAPIVLVIDTTKMTRSVAPLILGFKNFEPETLIAGVILNKISGKRHETKLRQAIEKYCDIEVVGAIPRLQKIEILERHLGLRPAKEEEQAVQFIESISQVVKDYVDLQALVNISNSNQLKPNISLFEKYNIRVSSSAGIELDKESSSKVKIGVAKDRAFTFYYPENIEALQTAGAQLIDFSPLNDEFLPDVDGLYIGGGFPEVFMKELEQNQAMRTQILRKIKDGMPVYAECGGLMYLAKDITWNKNKADMVGALPCNIFMQDKPKGHGYVKLKTLKNKWFDGGKEIKAHEFHHSEAVCKDKLNFAYKIERGKGIDGIHDGIIFYNVLASYAHINKYAFPDWADLMISFIKNAQLDI